MPRVKPSAASAVYERDEWLCRMPRCWHPEGRAIDPALRGVDDPWAPSVDHIRTQADGGSGAQVNLRAAHRLCNVRDGNAFNRNQPAPSPVRKPERPARRLPPLTFRVGDLFPGDQGSRWS